MVYIPELPAYIVIGGYGGQNRLSNIGKFQNGAWSDVGQLNKARSVSFRSIFLCLKTTKSIRAEWVNGDLIVAGGLGVSPVEICTLAANDQFNCVDNSLQLDTYRYGVSFIVPSDYCPE